jgi:hypothetical protein
MVLDFYAASEPTAEVIKRVESALAAGVVRDTFEIDFPIAVQHPKTMDE